VRGQRREIPGLGNYPDDQRFAPVQWPDAERYGAQAQRRDGTWVLWWFGPDDLVRPSPARYITGGGRAEVRLPDASQARVPTQEFLGLFRFKVQGPGILP